MLFCTEFVDGWWSLELLPATAALKTTIHPQTQCRKHTLQLNI
jgi:hypothetical protein